MKPVDELIQYIYKNNDKAFYTYLEQYLKENGFNINQKTLIRWDRAYKYCSLIVHAIYKNKIDIVSVLLEKGAKINYDHHYWLNPLIIAVSVGNIEMVRLLLKAGALPTLTKSDFPKQTTALISAIWANRLDLVQLLIEFGADPNEKVESIIFLEKNALAFSISEWHTPPTQSQYDLTEFLIKQGAVLAPENILLEEHHEILETLLRSTKPPCVDQSHTENRSFPLSPQNLYQDRPPLTFIFNQFYPNNDVYTTATLEYAPFSLNSKKVSQGLPF